MSRDLVARRGLAPGLVSREVRIARLTWELIERWTGARLYPVMLTTVYNSVL